MATIKKTITLGDRTIILTDGDPSDGTIAKIGSLATDFNGLGLFLKTGTSNEEWASVAVNMSPGDNWLEPATTRTNTPGSTVLGVRTLVGAAGTGAWATKSNQVAIGDGAGGWTYDIPVAGNIIEVTDTISTLRFTGTSWVIYPGTAILQGGNRLGAAMSIGTTDSFGVQFKTANVTRGKFTAAGNLNIYNDAAFGSSSVVPTAKIHVVGSSTNGSVYIASDGGWIEFNGGAKIKKVVGGDLTFFQANGGHMYWRDYADTYNIFSINDNKIVSVGHFYDGDEAFAVKGNGNNYLQKWFGNGGGSIRAVLSDASNFGLGTSTFGSSAYNTLAIVNNQAPTSSIADGIQIFAKDSADTTSTLGLYLEQAVEAGIAIASTDKLKVWINGTAYYIPLTAV